MQKIYLLLLIAFGLNCSLFCQTPEGTWKGTCHHENRITKLTITLQHAGGTIYKGTGIEENKTGGIRSKFKFDYWENSDGSGFIPVQSVSDIVAYWKDTIRTFKNYFLADDSLEHYFSVCLCDDNKRISFANDGVYNYLGSDCLDQMVFWNLAQKRPEKIPNVDVVSPTTLVSDHKVHCLNDDVVPKMVDTIFLSKHLPFEVRIKDFSQSDNDLVTLFSNSEPLFTSQTINNDDPIIIPSSLVDGMIDFTWCAESNGTKGPNTGEICFLQNKVLIAKREVQLLQGERARFVVIPMH